MNFSQVWLEEEALSLLLCLPSTSLLRVVARIMGELGSTADCLQGDWSQAAHLAGEWLHTSATEPLQAFLSLSLSWCSEVPQLDEVWPGRLRVIPMAQHGLR